MRQRVVGDAARELAEDVRGGGRHQQQLGVVGQADVPDVALLAQRELVEEHGMARERLERHRA